MQSFKQSLHVSKKEKRSLNHRVATFLFQYRNAAHATTEIPPAELMIGPHDEESVRSSTSGFEEHDCKQADTSGDDQICGSTKRFLCWGEGDGPRL